MTILQRSKYIIILFLILMLTYSCNRLRRYVKNVSLKDSVRVIYHDETDQNEEDLNPFYRIKPTNNATKKNRNPNEGASQSNLDGREW